MNSVSLTGRLTKDIELRKTNTNISVAQFSIAVDRGIKKEDGSKVTDFPNIIAWKQSAEFLSQYAAKGDLIEVTGKLTTRSYDGQQGKVYITEVVANEVRILSHPQPKQEGFGTVTPQEIKKQNDEFKNYNEPTFEQSDLPFY